MFGWPVICVFLFARLSFEKAIIASLLGGYMLLPSEFSIDWPLLPPIDKMGITALSTLLLCWMKGGGVRTTRRSILMYALGIAFVVAPILTSFDNSYELQQAGKSVHGFYPVDGLKTAGRNLLTLIPLHIGRRYLATEKARVLLLTAIPSAMLVYSLPMLFEMRMSPQLHRWVYGYFPSSFVQQMRAGGFRPVVFFPHGLLLAFFTALAVLCVFILIRSRLRVLRFDARPVAAYLSGLLLLCKSLGPTLYAAIFAPVILFTRPRLWVNLACAVALLLCAYPYLRSQSLAPTDLISDVARTVSAQRNDSFQTRLENEDLLMTKAEQKPWFGWGGWSRNRVFDEWTGKDISITDGAWIIYFGVYGWFGYLALYGLLTAALFQARRVVTRLNTLENITRGGLALLLAAALINCIPNSVDEWLLFLLAGSVSSLPVVTKPQSREKSVVRPEAQEPALASN